MTTSSRCLALFAGLLLGALAVACSDNGSTPTLVFQLPKDGATFCSKDDLNAATPAIDVRVEVKATGLREGTQVVLEDDAASWSDTQPVTGGIATFTVPLAAGNNRLVAHTVDNGAVALPPITVTSNTAAPSVAILAPLDGATLGAGQDADGDLTNGFQYKVEVRAEVEDGQTAELYVGGVLQPTVTITNKKATFASVTLPSGSVTLEAKVRNSCGNQGTDSATVTVQTGQPGCAVVGFSPEAVYLPAPGPGTVLNISTDADTTTAGMQTSLLVQVTPESGTKQGLAVEIYYGSGATPKATGTTDADGLATIALAPPDGSLTFSARCHDAANNTGVSQDLPALIDTVAPDCALALAGVDGVKASGLFNPLDDVDTGTGGVQITATLSSAATDVVGQPVTFAVNGTTVTGTVNVAAGGTAAKNVTITAGDQDISAALTDRAANACTVEKAATLVEAGCAVNFTNLTSASVLNIASDSAPGSTGLQYGVNLEVDAACVGQTLTLTSSKAGTIQQSVPTGTGMIPVSFANYTVCSGSCQEQVTLTATVEDTAGNITVKTVTFLADNVPPSANVQFWSPNTVSCGGVVTPAQDVDGNSGNGVQVDVLIITAADRTSLSVDVTSSGGTSTFTPTPSTSNVVRVTLGSGNNNIVAHVVSASGNPGQTTPACAISLQDIAVTFSSPLSGAKLGRSAGTVSGGNLLVTVSGTVSVTGASVTLSVDSGAPVATSMTGTTWTATNVALGEGPHSIRADATASGGRTGTASVGVQVDITLPDQAGALTVTPTNRATVDLSFAAPGDNAGGTGIVSYRIRYSTAAITDVNFASATPIAPSPPTPQAAGTTEHIAANTLRVNTGYYFAVAAVDGAGNQALVATAGPTNLVFTTATYGVPAIGNQEAAAQFGKSTAAGFLNADAYPDLVVGMPFASFATATAKEGAAMVYLGTSTGFHSTPDFVIRPAVGSWGGHSVAVLDFDGDGVQDLAIGAPGVAGFAGAVYVCRGGTRFAQPASPPTVIDPTGCELTVTRSTPTTNFFGFALARANFDGDDVDDLVIGSPGSGGFVGEAFILHGVKPMPSVTTFALPDDAMTATPTYRAWQLVFSGPGTPQHGSFVYGLGKLDGSTDSSDEVGVAGVSLDRAYVYYGREKPSTSAIAIPTTGAGVVALIGSSGSGVGTGMAGIGDTDGDGRREIAVGAPTEGAGGRVYLVNGGAADSGNPNALTLATATITQVPTVISGSGGEKLGSFIANPARALVSGDLNADTAVDLWIANASNPWKAYLFYGGLAGFGAAKTTADAAWYFTPTGGNAVYATLAVVPDVNGDLLPDLVAADWYSTSQSVVVLK